MKTAISKADQHKLDVLLEWKKAYIEALVKALEPKESFLEIGFGVGFAANAALAFHPKKHVIIESHPEVLPKALEWAKDKPHVSVVEERWEKALPKLGQFDAIFFNDYPIQQDIGIIHFLFTEEVKEATQEAKNVLNQLQKEMAKLTQPFSDKEVEEFYEKMGKFNSASLPQFFAQLNKQGNITKAQYDKYVKKFHIGRKEELPVAEKDIMLLCLEECLKHNMKKGSRFVPFLNSQSSKYEDALFFQQVITNPQVLYQESSIQLKLSDKAREGLIATIQLT